MKARTARVIANNETLKQSMKEVFKLIRKYAKKGKTSYNFRAVQYGPCLNQNQIDQLLKLGYRITIRKESSTGTIEMVTVSWKQPEWYEPGNYAQGA